MCEWLKVGIKSSWLELDLCKGSVYMLQSTLHSYRNIHVMAYTVLYPCIAVPIVSLECWAHISPSHKLEPWTVNLLLIGKVEKYMYFMFSVGAGLIVESEQFTEAKYKK